MMRGRYRREGVPETREGGQAGGQVDRRIRKEKGAIERKEEEGKRERKKAAKTGA